MRPIFMPVTGKTRCERHMYTACMCPGILHVLHTLQANTCHACICMPHKWQHSGRGMHGRAEDTEKPGETYLPPAEGDTHVYGSVLSTRSGRMIHSEPGRKQRTCAKCLGGPQGEERRPKLTHHEVRKPRRPVGGPHSPGIWNLS